MIERELYPKNLEHEMEFLADRTTKFQKDSIMIFNISSILLLISLFLPIFSIQKGFSTIGYFRENINMINLAFNGIVFADGEKYYNVFPFAFLIITVLSLFWTIRLLRDVNAGFYPSSVMWFGLFSAISSTLATVTIVDALIEFNERKPDGTTISLSFNFGFYVLVINTALLYFGTIYALMNRFERFYPKITGVKEKNEEFMEFSTEFLGNQSKDDNKTKAQDPNKELQ